RVGNDGLTGGTSFAAAIEELFMSRMVFDHQQKKKGEDNFSLTLACSCGVAPCDARNHFWTRTKETSVQFRKCCCAGGAGTGQLRKNTVPLLAERLCAG